MSISNNIDGSAGGSGQLLDFLSLVTNPKIYEAKIKALQEVTAEHQKFVELVAPATEIMDLREKVKAEKDAAKNKLEEANLKSETLVIEAQNKADAILADAQAKAEVLVNEAKAAADDAKLAQSEARKSANEVKKAKSDYDNLSVSLKDQQDELAKTQAKAEAVKKAAEALRIDLIEKHTAFIKSL
jgi:cell division septum initiation protein DivIVA